MENDAIGSSFVFDEKTNTIINYLSKIGGKNVVIPSMINGILVKVIGENSFRNKDIDKVYIPASVEIISKHAFSNSKIKVIEFSEGLVEIEEGAFSNNIINNIRFPETLIKIGKNAFENSFISGSLTLPSCLKIIDEYAFRNNNISQVEVKSDIKLPNGSRIFEKNMIDKVKFTEKVSIVPEYMFASCLLKEIEFSQSIIDIGHHAFSNNIIAKVVLPKSIKKLGDYAFSLNQIVELDIPESVEMLGKNFIWIQNKTIKNDSTKKYYLRNRKIIVELMKIDSSIKVENIENPMLIIRNNVITNVKVDLNNHLFIIDLNSISMNYFTINTNDVFYITYDYKICNSSVKSNGCNSINLVFSTKELT